MKEDKIKDFIDLNRSEFDDIERPNLDQIWSSVENTIPEKRFPRIWIVFAFFGIALLGTLIYSNVRTMQKLNNLENYVLQSPTHKSEHERLIKLVSDKELEIKKQSIDKSQFEEIYQELEELELNQISIEKDFETYGNSEELMRTLFKHYERKTKILEILLLENEKRKYNEDINRHQI